MIARTMALLASVGLKPVHVRRDIPGFNGNRLQQALKREAIALVADGVCDAQTIDEVVRSGFGARMAVLGPWSSQTLSASTLRSTFTNRLSNISISRQARIPYLRSKVAQGKLGMKTGEGFRRWTPQQADEVRERLRRFLADQAKARSRSR